MGYRIGDAEYAGDIWSAQRPVERKTRVEWLAPLLCFAFGAACLIYVVGPGDGTWTLYAREMAAGHRLYSDLGLNQQPLFPLLALAATQLSPGGLLGDKVIFFGVLAVHVMLIFLVSRRAAGRGPAGLLLGTATYFTAIHFEAFRYDDYHAVAQCLVLASLYLALRYSDGKLTADRLALAQGALAAAAFLTRVNEGLAIAGAVAILFVSAHGLSRLTGRLVLLAALGAACVFALVLLLIGETPSTWFYQTLVAASAAKGGDALLMAPWRVFVHAAQLLLRPAGLFLVVSLLVITFALVAIRPTSRRHAALIGGAAALCAFAVLKSCDPDAMVPLVPLALMLSAAGLAWWAVRWAVRRPGGSRDTNQLSLLAYPLLMFATGALSSGGRVYPLFFPVALALLVGALLLRKPLSDERRASLRIASLWVVGLIALDAFAYRVRHPYSWLAYRVNPMFVDSRFENDAVRGPHVVTRELHDLIAPVCANVAPGKSLLSLPYSFANYYCGVPVWHGYVQSFFDTSTRSRIRQIEADLEKDPPDFILYQRQLSVLRFHEVSFAGGQPLPHRELDKLIVERVRSGEWTVVYRSAAYPPSTWYLIRTRTGAR